jgi:hypothetical protein
MLCAHSTRQESSPALTLRRNELGAIADDGGHWELATVADGLAELESLGKLERPAAFEWEGIGPPPKTRIAYAVTGE